MTLLLLVAFAANTRGQNLLTNPGFEQGTGFAIPGWEVSVNTSFTQGTGLAAHTGSKSLGMTDSGSEEVNYIKSTSFVYASPGEAFLLSTWVKTTNFNASDGVSVALEQLNSAGTTLSLSQGPILRPGTADWFQINVPLTATNGNTARVAVLMIFYNSRLIPNGARAYFDDVSLSRQTAASSPQITGFWPSNTFWFVTVTNLVPGETVSILTTPRLPVMAQWTNLTTFSAKESSQTERIEISGSPSQLFLKASVNR